MSKEDFKAFVRRKPKLIEYVKNNNSSWQKIYEIYELYGENNSIWDEYLKDKPRSISNSFTDIINTIKGIDLEKLQSGIDSIQNTISMIQNFSTNNKNTQNNNYQPRYQYHHMDD